MSNRNIEWDNFKEIIEFYKLTYRVKVRTYPSNISESNKVVYSAYFREHFVKIKRDVKEAIEEYYKVKGKNISQFIEGIDGNEKIDYYSIHLIGNMVDLHVIFRLFNMKEYLSDDLENLGDVSKEKDNLWFRGQTNSKWSFVPSFFRNNNETKLWTWNTILQEYASKPSAPSLVEKLLEIDIDPNINPYKFLAFIQHAISFSPLIDFSKNSRVALSFALSNQSKILDFYKDESCVYRLNISDFKVLKKLSEIDEVIKNVRIQSFKESTNVSTIIQNQLWKDLLLEKTSSVVHLINLPTNDRMLYQKGVFALFDNVIIIGNEIYFSKNKIGFFRQNLKKFIIKAETKESLIAELYNKNPQYHHRYLNNPYLFLEDYYSIK